MVDLARLFLALWLFFFGAILGSFLNVVALHSPSKTLWTHTRSACPHCGATLRAVDLVPLFSYLFLRGRCHHCQTHISWRYPFVEMLCGLCCLLCVLRFGFDLRALYAFALLLLLTTLSLIDLDTLEIPNVFHLLLIPFALGAWALWPEIGLGARLVGIFVVSLPLLLLTLFLAGAFGGGDIKLMAVCGFLLGWKLTLVAFFLALLFGGGWALWLLLSKKVERGAHIAFGPALCVGVGLALFYGSELFGWYLSLF